MKAKECQLCVFGVWQRSGYPNHCLPTLVTLRTFRSRCLFLPQRTQRRTASDHPSCAKNKATKQNEIGPRMCMATRRNPPQLLVAGTHLKLRSFLQARPCVGNGGSDASARTFGRQWLQCYRWIIFKSW